jgi:hypothetical protein
MEHLIYNISHDKFEKEEQEEKISFLVSKV